MSNNVKEVLIVGAGYMAREYAKVLDNLGCHYCVVGRGEESASRFENETGHPVIRGGVDQYFKSNNVVPEYCIVAVQIEQLVDTCRLLLMYGGKNILLEKPGALELNQLCGLAKLAREKNAEISIAYNRRFYAAVMEAEKYIEKDGGVTSLHFEFTEWLHKMSWFEKNYNSVWRVFVGNSTHVIDLAFFLGGVPKEISCYSTVDVGGTECSVIFSGAGKTESGALFSYQANWGAPGRWSVEIITSKHRLIFRPLEELQVQNLNSIKVESVEVDYSLDTAYKPGLYLETKAFLEHNVDFYRLCSLKEQIEKMNICSKMIELPNI